VSDTRVPELSARPATTGGSLRGMLFFLFSIFWCSAWGIWCTIFGLLRAQWLTKLGIRCWSGGTMFCSGVRVAVTRRALLDAAKSYVFLCNHQSAMDIPILMQACFPDFNVRFFAKESLFKIPFMGWSLGATGFIPIRRESPRHSAEIFKQMAKRKNALPYSYIVFPEGTRSPDGRLQPFKKGSFGLAVRLGIPVVPVTLIDACRVNPKGSYKLRKGTVQVVFHEPIPVNSTDDGGSREDRDALLDKVYAAVLSALPDDQRPS
jgi:1-acyl-sn-glycerol-3-phosphate acyltransferase